MVWVGGVLLGCAPTPQVYGPLAACGTVFPERTAHLAGCVVELEDELFDADGAARTFQQRTVYDDLGLSVRSEHLHEGELGHWTDWERDDAGEVVRSVTEATDGDVYETDYERDDRGMVLRELQSSTNAEGRTSTETTYVVDPDSCTWTTATRSEGQTLSAEWNRGHLSMLRTEQGGEWVETRWAYNRQGLWDRRVERASRGDTRRAENTYDGDLLVQRVTSGGGLRKRWVWEYDDEGREVRVRVWNDGELGSTKDTTWHGPYPATAVYRDGEEGRLRGLSTWTWDCPGA